MIYISLEVFEESAERSQCESEAGENRMEYRKQDNVESIYVFRSFVICELETRDKAIMIPTFK